MAVKRIVCTSFWTDGKVDEFSPEDKYFMLYLLTNPFTTQLGIYEISIKQVAFQLGYSMDAVKVLLDRFENKYGMIRYSPQTGEIAIKNYLKHSIVKGGAPVHDLLTKELKRVKDRTLIPWVFSNIKDTENLNATVKNIIAEYEEKNGALLYRKEKRTKKEIQNDNENDNDNENEVSYPDSYNESSTNRSPILFGIYHNVKLTEKEYITLQEEFPLDYFEKIDRLSTYMETSGKSYNNHLAKIREWAMEDAQKQKKTDSRHSVGNQQTFRGEQRPDNDDDALIGPFNNEKPKKTKKLPTDEEVEDFRAKMQTDYPDFTPEQHECFVESFKNGNWSK